MILTFLKHNWGWMILIIILMSTCNRYRLESNTAHLNADKFKLGFSATGRKYGVSDNAIRKWIKNYNKE